MSFKFTVELCVMTMKNNAKFEEELTFHFKTDSSNLTNFDLSTQKSKKMLFNLLFNCSRKLSSSSMLVDFFSVQYIHLFLGHDGCFKN